MLQRVTKTVVKLPWLVPANHSTHFRILWIGAILLVPLLTGCSKEESTAEPAAVGTNAAAMEPSRAPVYTAPANPAPVATAAGEPDFNAMNRELRRWILRNQRPPKNFEEFAASAGVQFPPPPPGKKYVIDKTMHVILVKQ